MTTTLHTFLVGFYILLTSVRAEGAADVTAPTGRVVGLELDVLGTTVHAFLGIPFAQPPVGERRFRRAEPIEPWDGIYNANRKPSACLQDLNYYGVPESVYDPWTAEEPISEDCLYLNVWQPTPVPTGSAVMVWLYGGGYQVGSTALELYDGKSLAAMEGIIIVSVNYRLSTLGFLYTGTDDAPGNMGLTDMVMALKWVQENIASFGGDPAKVTIFGESVGGMSVGYLTMSTESRDLFTRGIVQSGAAVTVWGRDSTSTANDKTQRFAEEVGCPFDQGIEAIVDCLKDKDGRDLVDTSLLRDISFYPVIDGSFFTESPKDALNDGNFKHADILIGSTTNEGPVFFLDLPGFDRNTESLINEQQFKEGIQYMFPELNEFAVDAVAYQYTAWSQPETDTMYRDALDRLYGDYMASCPDGTTARAHVRQGASTYMYEFAHRAANSPWPEWMGVVHGAEIEFVFGRPLNSTLGYTAEEVALSRRVMRRWANFARTGNPNNNNGISWSAFNQTDGGYMVLDTDAPRMRVGPRFKECDFWDNYVQPLMAKTDSLMMGQPCKPAASAASGDTKSELILLNLKLTALTTVYTFSSLLV